MGLNHNYKPLLIYKQIRTLRDVMEITSFVPEKEGLQSKFFFIFSTVFCATWLASDIAAIKLVSFWGIVLTGGFITFPITTLFNSIIVDVYGYKSARQAIWSGFILNITFLLSMHLIHTCSAILETST